MKLTIEEHKQIALHLHAIDHHLSRVAVILGSGSGHLKVPREIFSQLQDVSEEIGATSSPSGHSLDSIAGRLEDVLLKEWPEATLEVYHGSYADCSTIAMLGPDQPLGTE